MIPRIHILIPTLILFFLSAESQKISKSDKAILANLQTHFQSITADTQEANKSYLISGLSNAGARPKGDNNGWIQSYTIDYGRQPQEDALFSVDNKALTLYKEWFPLSICPAARLTGSPAIALQESGVPWFQDLKEMLEAGLANPHFDLVAAIRAKAAACKKRGATALILYNSSHFPDKLAFDPKDKPQPADIPVLYITRDAKRKYLKDESASVDLSIRIDYREQRVVGRNIIGALDNGAPATVAVITRQDNSSGIAALLELVRLLAASKLRNNNYLFIIYNGTCESWLGSGIYMAHPAIDPRKVNYLLELDALGSLSDTTHTLTIGGYATSAAWEAIGNAIREKKSLSLRYDSSSPGGDRAIFYKQRIPFLLFATDPGHPVNYLGELQVLKYIYATIESANTRGKIDFAP